MAEVELNAAAERTGKSVSALRREVCDALVQAARTHFGEGHVFEAQFEDGALVLHQMVTVKAEPAEPFHRSTSSLRAAGMEVDDNDELAFEVMLDPSRAHTQDHQYGAITRIVTKRSGFAALARATVRRVVGLPPPERNLVAEAARTAVLLAALPPAERESPARWTRFRAVTGPHGGLQVKKSYVVGRDVPREAVRVLLDREDVGDGAAFELFFDLVGVKELLVGLLDPAAAAIAVAAKHVGVPDADVRLALKACGVDLEQRHLDGRPWTSLEHAMKHSFVPLRVVAQVTQAHGEISLAEARWLEPAAQPGLELRFPSLDRESCPGLMALCADDDSVRHVDAHGVGTFEPLLPTVAPVQVPAPLVGLGLGPLRQLYPQGHGVLYVEVPGAEAQALWTRLDAAASRTGYRPVILGGDVRDLQAGMTSWEHESHEGLQAGAHPSDSPGAVLAAAETVDLGTLLRPGGNPSYPGLEPDHGEWPPGPSGDQLGALRNPLNQELWPRVRVALVPVDAAWKAVAYLPMLLQAGEATPSMAQACAVSRLWEDDWGAKVISLRPAAIEWWVERPPTRSNAMEIACAHFTFTPEGGSNVLEERANELVSPVWSAWWD
ncbi:MAG: DUF4253 domain-containing protein [Archangium sp.]|nr:DUF4253 domain-containing protein [Archangium sp.]